MKGFIAATMLFLGAGAAGAQESLSLDGAVQAGLLRDERARTAAVQVGTAERGGKQAATLFAPRVAASALMLIQQEIDIPGFGVVQPNLQYQVGGALTQPLYDHSYWGLRDQNRGLLSRAQHQSHYTREQVAMDVINAYYEVLNTDRRVQLAQNAVERAQAQVNLAKARVGAGAALKTALLQAQIDLDRFNREVANAQGNQRVAREQLSRLTGAPTDVRLVEPPLQQPGASDLDDAVASAERSRPDLRAAADQIKADEGALAAARARLYPSLVGQVSYTHSEPQTVFTFQNLWKGTITLNIPLFQSGTEYLAIHDREDALSISRLNHEQLRKLIRTDVARAWAAWETARRQADLSDHQLVFARENNDLVTAQFRGGSANSTDVTVAQTGLLEAEFNAVLARYAREVAAAAVRFQTGTLLTADAPSSSTAR